MSIEPILFWLFAGTAVVGALMAVLLPRIIHAVFSLMLCFVGVAAISGLNTRTLSEPRFCGRCWMSSVLLWVSATPRSMKLDSSRTLPG